MGADRIHEPTKPNDSHSHPGWAGPASELLLGLAISPISAAATPFLPQLTLAGGLTAEHAIDPNHNLRHALETAGQVAGKVFDTTVHIGGDIVHGAVEEARHHPVQLLTDVAIGAAIGAGSILLPEVVIPATIAYGAIEVGAHASQIVHAVHGYANDTAVIADSNRHTKQELAAADHDLEGLGAFGAHVVAGAIGSGIGGVGTAALRATATGTSAGGLSAALRAGCSWLKPVRVLSRAEREAGAPEVLPPVRAVAEAPQAPRASIDPRAELEDRLRHGYVTEVRQVGDQGSEEMRVMQGKIGNTPVMIRTAPLEGEPAVDEVSLDRVRQEVAFAKIHDQVFDNKLPATVARAPVGGKVTLVQENGGQTLDSMPDAGHLYDTNPQFRDQVDQAAVSQLIYGAEAHGGNFVVTETKGSYNVANIDLDPNNINRLGGPMNVPDKLNFDADDPFRTRLTGDLSATAKNKVTAFINRFDNPGGRADLSAAGLNANEIDPMAARAHWLQDKGRYPTPADQPKPGK